MAPATRIYDPESSKFVQGIHPLLLLFVKPRIGYYLLYRFDDILVHNSLTPAFWRKNVAAHMMLSNSPLCTGAFAQMFSSLIYHAAFFVYILFVENIYAFP